MPPPGGRGIAGVHRRGIAAFGGRESRRLAADSVVILISHRLYLFPELDRVIWLENGEAKVGTHEELVGNIPDYAAQFDAQREENSHE